MPKRHRIQKRCAKPSKADGQTLTVGVAHPRVTPTSSPSQALLEIRELPAGAQRRLLAAIAWTEWPDHASSVTVSRFRPQSLTTAFGKYTTGQKSTARPSSSLLITVTRRAS